MSPYHEYQVSFDSITASSGQGPVFQPMFDTPSHPLNSQTLRYRTQNSPTPHYHTHPISVQIGASLLNPVFLVYKHSLLSHRLQFDTSILAKFGAHNWHSHFSGVLQSCRLEKGCWSCWSSSSQIVPLLVSQFARTAQHALVWRILCHQESTFFL